MNMKRCSILLGVISVLGTSLSTTGFCQSPAPIKDIVLYAPGHFGNSYEVMSPGQMRDYLAACKAYGFNRYADWYDTVDCTDPFSGQRHTLLGASLWQRKKAHFLSAQSLGLSCELLITPNHVFAEQCCVAPATQSERIFGQLVCPSQPEGRKIILQNYQNWFADLAASGIQLKVLWSAPYDYGGCACAACSPWILTFAELSREIFAIAAAYHPGIEMRFIGWWWSEEEHRRFAAWADQEAPGCVKSIALHIPYGKMDVSDVPLPKGCERQAFVHIGYAEDAKPRDIYGQFGPVAAPSRLQHTLDSLKQHGCTGVVAYSEGVFDDVNKFLLAGLASGQHADAASALAEYARRFFNADERTAKKWTDWLTAWGRSFNLQAKTLRPMPGDPAPRKIKENWRMRQWDFKIELLQAHNRIMAMEGWTAERSAAVDEYWQTHDRLEREVWGLGPTRGCLARTSSHLPWYAEWAEQTAAVTVKDDAR